MPTPQTRVRTGAAASPLPSVAPKRLTKSKGPRRRVFLFDTRFVPLMLGNHPNLKRQTLRKLIKGQPNVRFGDILEFRHWEGIAYRSKQVKFAEATCSGVFEVAITDRAEFIVNGEVRCRWEADKFAQRDGFTDYAHLFLYVVQNYGLPFRGRAIRWDELSEGGAR